MRRQAISCVLVLALALVGGCPATPGTPDMDAGPRDDAASGDAGRLDASGAADARECDEDGDGHDAAACGGDDCDDTDPGRHPQAAEVCDAAHRDEDCDPTTFGARDADSDSYVDAACCNVDGAGTMHCGDDCDDARSTRHPDLPEVCNDIDDDCDVAIDEGVLVACWTDNDGDTYAPSSATTSMACTCPARTTARMPDATSTDCNDTLPDVSPGSPEICGNGRDDDCDTLTDEAGTHWFPDCDGDGYGEMGATPVIQCSSPGRPMGCTAAGAGHVQNEADCDDAAITVHPGQPDLCNGRDEDCDAATADGAGDARVGAACDGPDADRCLNGASVCGGGVISCGETGPSHAELCGGGDDDCDGTVDEFSATLADCLGRMLPNTVSSVCVAGVCEAMGCTAGHEDCSASPGCESTCSWRGCSAGACDDAVRVSAWNTGSPGESLSCAVRRSGQLVCWGRDSAGPHSVPVTVPITDAIDVDGPCVLRSGGVVERLTGRFDDPWTPVVGLAGATQVSCGFFDGGCAVRADHSVYCWGSVAAPYGLLGNGGTTGTSGVVSGLNDAVEVRVGYRSACARRASGQVVCWGQNEFGQLGDGVASHATCTDGTRSFDCALTPVTVSGLSDAQEIAASHWNACARRSTGQIVCWGAGFAIGDGAASHGATCPGLGTPMDCARVPVPVPGASATTRLVSGGAASFGACVVRSSGGGIACWSLGTPQDLTGFSGVTQLATGATGSASEQHVCGIDAAGVRCQGANDSGQLGDGTTTMRASAVPVLSP